MVLIDVIDMPAEFGGFDSAPSIPIDKLGKLVQQGWYINPSLDDENPDKVIYVIDIEERKGIVTAESPIAYPMFGKEEIQSYHPLTNPLDYAAEIEKRGQTQFARFIRIQEAKGPEERLKIDNTKKPFEV